MLLLCFLTLSSNTYTPTHTITHKHPQTHTQLHTHLSEFSISKKNKSAPCLAIYLVASQNIKAFCVLKEILILGRESKTSIPLLNFSINQKFFSFQGAFLHNEIFIIFLNNDFHFSSLYAFSALAICSPFFYSTTNSTFLCQPLLLILQIIIIILLTYQA